MRAVNNNGNHKNNNSEANMHTEVTRLDWLTWWASGCVWQSDPSWKSEAIFPVERQKARAFMHANIPLLSRHFDLPMQLPPEPVVSLMQIGTLSAFQREQILNLIAAACQPPAPSSVLTDEQITWCRRLAKALRPGLWLSQHVAFTDGYADALTLLRVRYGEICWPRLRLLFPQSWVTRCRKPEYALPAGRLNTLCDALVWKAAAVTQDGAMS
ncbi:type III secretion protein [Brenneria roseae]|nr:type III secretion protein [Brenneria roseae]